jgi:hypothetical protein
MEPTLSEGDIVLAVPVRSVFWERAPASLALLLTGRAEAAPVRRGDLVVARSPTQPTRHIVKRVGRESVKTGFRTIVQVTLLEKDRIPLESRLDHRFVPPGRAWLQGDNTANVSVCPRALPRPVGRQQDVRRGAPGPGAGQGGGQVA